MRDRYRLRFLTGDRRGEEVVLPGGTVTLGRRPDNAIQVADASVSGRHAQIAVDDGGAVLRDLGSTNGTRVGGRPISGQVRLAHGDEIALGNVRLAFGDREFDEASSAAEPESGDLELGRIDAGKLARSKRRSLGTLLALVVVAGGAGWLAWRLLGGEATGPSALRPVTPVAKNLLGASYSFEQEGSSGWEADLDAPAAFGASRSAAWSGTSGLSAPLAAGEWALSRSPSVTASGALRLTARVRTSGGARARLGFELQGADAEARTCVAWSGDEQHADWDEVEVPGTVFPGCDRVRVLVLAQAQGQEGEVELDDVALVPSGAPAATPEVGEYQLTVAPTGDVASLFKIDRVLLQGLAVTSAGGLRARRARLSARATETGFEISVAGAPEGARLHATALSSVAGQVATLGPEGYRRRRSDFDGVAATTVLIGSGLNLVALAFDAPVNVSGGPDGDAFRIAVGPDLPAAFRLQVSFAAERGEAAGLARTARRATQEGRVGDSLAAWERLLGSFPFEQSLVEEATQGRAELLRAGLEELGRVRTEIERAEFFGLPELYRQCRADLQSLAQDYAGTSVEESCQAELKGLDEKLGSLERELDAAEVERLREIHSMLAAADMPRLAALVEDYLAERYGVAAGNAASGEN